MHNCRCMKQNNVKQILTIVFIQAAVCLYTLSGVAGKFASRYDFLSFPFVGLYTLEIAILGCYAILWQQIIKRVPLSIAYANRSLSLIWSILWSTLLFHESLTQKNVIGIMLVVVGVYLVNMGGLEE